MAEKINIGGHGAFGTEDENADGYYIVKWTSVPYTLQEDVELTEFTPAIRIKAGELVCDADYYNKVPGARHWYTPTQGEERKTTVRVKQVLAPHLELKPISDENPLPNAMKKGPKAEAKRLGALRIIAADDANILEESARRELLEHDEAESSDDEDEEEEEEESEDDEDSGGEEDDQ